MGTAAFILAHAPIKGIGNLYNGILHPLLVPTHLILIVTLGLLMGQRSEDVATWPRAFLVALIPGLLLAAFAPAMDLTLLILPLAAACGLLVALHLPLKKGLITALAILGALAIGVDSAPDGLNGKILAVSLAGTWLGASLSLFYVALICHRLRRNWQQVGVRVVASWATASALLVLALKLAGK